MEHNRTIENGPTVKARVWYGGQKKTLQVVATDFIAYRYSKGCYAKIVAKDNLCIASLGIPVGDEVGCHDL